MSIRLRAGLALLFSLTVTACGGGGGSDADGSVSPTTSGLVPTPPAAGATIYKDATVLRPTVSTAVWTYRGVQTNTGAQGTPIIYTNAITQLAQPDGSTKESATDSGHSGPDEQTVVVREGEVHAVSIIDLGNGQSRELNQLELRSPVRVGDQYTLLDTHVADIGLDVDGDSRPDAMDIALFSRVIGQETLDLINLPKVATVRVTLTVVTRLLLSKTGTRTDPMSGTVDTWYAPGIGVVKRRSDVPASTTTASGSPTRDVITETLVNLDGVSRGIGYLAKKPATDSAGVQIQRVLGAVGFDSHALVMSAIDKSSSTGIALTVLDGRGRAATSNTYDITINSRLVRVGGVARVLAYRNEFPAPTGIEMHSFDSAGNATGAPSVVLKPGPLSSGADTTFAAVGSGDALWIVWIEAPTGGASEHALLARAFDASGTPLAAAQTLGTYLGSPLIRNLHADGAPGHVIVSWDEATMAGFVSRYALIDGPASASPHTLHSGSVTPFGAYPSATSTGSLVVWSRSPNAPNGIGGVAFDSTGEPLRSNDLAIEDEVLPQPWLSQAGVLLTLGGESATLLAVSFETLFPEDTARDLVTTVVDVVAGTQPLATSSDLRLLARVPQSGSVAAVRLDSQILLFSEAIEGVEVTTVWRHN